MLSSIDELIQTAYRPLPDVVGQLEVLMSALADTTRATGGALRLDQRGALLLSRNQTAVDVRWQDGAVEHASQGAAADPRSSLATTLTYGGHPIGKLSLSWPRAPDDRQAISLLCREFARECAFLIKRHDIRRFTQERFGQPMSPVGMSRALRAVERFIERVSGSPLPVLITGEPGTEKVQTAAAIHGCGPNRDAPFVEVRCAVCSPSEIEDRVAVWAREARGGSLFINGIDELCRQSQDHLARHLQSRLGQWIYPSGDQAPTRVIASTTQDLHAMAEAGTFSEKLRDELDILTVCLPPLRSRVPDLASLIDSALQEYGFAPESKRTDALIEACESYSWPGNFCELKRVIARLAVMTGEAPIERADILDATPWIASNPGRRRVDSTSYASHDRPIPAAAERWARCLVARDLSRLGELHEGMQRALRYLCEHFTEPITLGQLASHACLSPSHLSYLFKRTLGTTFKPFLGLVRIEKAKLLLGCNDRLRITDVALSVGVGDLSHFEKLFRRHVDQSPRDYRRQMSKQAQGDG